MWMKIIKNSIRTDDQAKKTKESTDKRAKKYKGKCKTQTSFPNGWVFYNSPQ